MIPPGIYRVGPKKGSDYVPGLDKFQTFSILLMFFLPSETNEEGRESY